MRSQEIHELTQVEAFHVAALVHDLQDQLAPSCVNQHLAAIRMLFDWLVIGHVIETNPAHAVRPALHGQERQDARPDGRRSHALFWMDKTSGVALNLKTGVPSYQVEDEEGRTHLLIQVPIEEENEDRWCL